MTETGLTEHKQLLSDYLEVWNGDFSKLTVVSESVTVYDPSAPGGEVHGRDALEAFLRELRAGFPDFQLTIDVMLVSDDVVMGEWTFTGTHDGEFNDIPPTEREIELTGMEKILIADSKVEEHRIYYNLQELSKQLGLTEDENV